jgi:transposase
VHIVVYGDDMLIHSDKITNQLIDLRRQANFWHAQHGRVVERERALKEELSQLKRTLRDQYTVNEQLTKDNERQTARITWLEQQLFGRKSEKTKQRKIPRNASQGSSSKTPSSTNPLETTPKEPRKRGKQNGDKGYGRKLREQLQFEEIFVDVPEDLQQCPICGKRSSAFPGTEDSEVIDWQITLVRLIYRRKRCRRPCNCQDLPCIYTAPPVPKLIPKGMFSCNFWSQLLIEKFLLQRPLYRIRQALSLEELDVSDGTLTGGLQRIADLIRPLYTLTIERNREANHWKMDETRWMVYAEVDGKKGYKHWLWVSITNDTCVYLLEPTRSAEVPRKLLGENAQGIINADRYSAYKALGDLILIAFCWSHIRRDFVRISDGYKSLKKWADKWVARIVCIQ